MIIEIDFCQIERKEGQIERKEVRKAVIAAFDLLGEKEKGGIFRDDYEYTNDEASYGTCL